VHQLIESVAMRQLHGGVEMMSMSEEAILFCQSIIIRKTLKRMLQANRRS
jgi:hypothetical protein